MNAIFSRQSQKQSNLRCRGQRGSSLLEATGVMIILFPILLSGFGVAEYLGITSQANVLINSTLARDKVAAKIATDVTSEGIRYQENSDELRLMTQRIKLWFDEQIKQSLDARSQEWGNYRFDVFCIHQTKDTAPQIRFTDRSGGLGLGTGASPESQVLALAAKNPVRSDLDGSGYSFAAVVQLRFGSASVGSFFSKVSGIDRITVSKIVPLRGEVAWQH